MSGERRLRRVLRPVDGPASRASSGSVRTRRALMAVDAALLFAGRRQVR